MKAKKNYNNFLAILSRHIQNLKEEAVLFKFQSISSIIAIGTEQQTTGNSFTAVIQPLVTKLEHYFRAYIDAKGSFFWNRRKLKKGNNIEVKYCTTDHASLNVLLSRQRLPHKSIK